MPKVHTHTTYSYEELSKEAKEKAVEGIRERLGGGWWDSSDNDDIAATMLDTLAHEFKSPGVDECGGDFAGISGLTVEEWDVDRGEYKLGGCLTPKSAPALPWPDKAQQYVFASRHNSAYLDVEIEDDEGAWVEQINPPADFEDKIRDAINAALKAGRDEVEYKTSEAYAKEWIEGNEPSFNEDGTLHI